MLNDTFYLAAQLAKLAAVMAAAYATVYIAFIIR